MKKQELKELILKGLTNQEIALELNVSKSTVSYQAKKMGLNNLFKYKKNESFILNKIDTSDKAYFLGFLLADGYIGENNHVELGVAIKDKIILEYISKIINSNVHDDYTFDKKKRRFPRARTKKKINDITKFTGGRLKPDRHYPRVKDEFEKYLLLGFFDGDGCVTFGRRKDRNRLWQKVSFTSSLSLLEGIQKFLIRKLDISTVLRPKKNENCYVLEISNKKNVIKILDFIYLDTNIVLKRKYNKYKALRLELEENGETI